MALNAPVRGGDVSLLPNTGGTITLGSIGSGGSLHLSQAEIDQVAPFSFFLHIGENASGSVSFAGNLLIGSLRDIRTDSCSECPQRLASANPVVLETQR